MTAPVPAPSDRPLAPLVAEVVSAAAATAEGAVALAELELAGEAAVCAAELASSMATADDDAAATSRRTVSCDDGGAAADVLVGAAAGVDDAPPRTVESPSGK